MKMGMYAIFDDKAKTFTQPIFRTQDGMATRDFATLVNDQDTPFGKYPADYTLFKVGMFDDGTGEVENQPPENLGNGVTYKDYE